MFLHRENTPEEDKEVHYLETQIKPMLQKIVPLLLKKRSENPVLHMLNKVREMRQNK